MTSEQLQFERVENHWAALGAVARRVLDTLALWRRRAEQRALLAQFNQHMLRDIGLSEAEVWRESGRLPWQG